MHRIMPPCTPHAVLTLKDNVAIGGHFYSYCTMIRTLDALVQERYFGSIITNTEHTRAPPLLVKGFVSRVQALKDKITDRMCLSSSMCCALAK